MTDGAHLNIGANDAMKFVVGGGDRPKPMTDAEFEASIRTAPYESEFDYGTSSNAIARSVLEAYEKYPQLRDLSIDHLYLHDEHGDIDWSNPIVLNVELYDVMKKLHPEGSLVRELYAGMSGFMWGWAVNAARKVLGLGPMPNPAILTFTVSS